MTNRLVTREGDLLPDSPLVTRSLTMAVLRSFLLSVVVLAGCLHFREGVVEVTGSQLGPEAQHKRTLLLTYLPECLQTNEGRLGATERALRSTFATTAARKRGDARYTESAESVSLDAQIVGDYDAYSTKIISLVPPRSSSSSELRRPEQFFEGLEDDDDDERPSGECQVSEESLRRVGVDVIDLRNCVMLDSEDFKEALETDPCIASVEYDQEISLDSLRPLDQQLSLLGENDGTPESPVSSDDQGTAGDRDEENNEKTNPADKVESTPTETSPDRGAMSAQQERRPPPPPPLPFPSEPRSSPNYWRFKAGLDDSVYSRIDCQPDRVVAVIDTGITYDHPALAKNVWVNKAEIPGNGIDDDKNGFIDDVYGFNFRDNKGDPYDDHGHGTHVAGIIGAVLNDSNALVKGVCGRTSIAGLKFMGGNGNGSTSDAIKALNYAVQMRIPLSCNSWGGPTWSEALIAALEAADSVGHLFVAAAGNQGRNTDEIPHYPASYRVPNVISVAASTSTDELASFSNRGPLTVDLAAPGVKILSTFPPDRFKELSGTSMATPVVAGVAALLMSFPYQNISQVKRAIVNGVDRPPAVEDLMNLKACEQRKLDGVFVDGASTCSPLLVDKSLLGPIQQQGAALRSSFPVSSPGVLPCLLGGDADRVSSGWVKSGGRVNARKAVTWLSLELGIDEESKRQNWWEAEGDQEEKKKKSLSPLGAEEDPSRKTTMRDSSGSERGVEKPADSGEETIVPVTA